MRMIRTNKGKEYQCVFCAEIPNGLMFEVRDTRKLSEVAPELEDLTDIHYDFPEADITNYWHGAFRLDMLQHTSPSVLQVKLTETGDVV